MCFHVFSHLVPTFPPLHRSGKGSINRQFLLPLLSSAGRTNLLCENWFLVSLPAIALGDRGRCQHAAEGDRGRRGVFGVPVQI